MGPLLVILMIVLFITADVAIRHLLKQMEENRIKKERLAALDIGLKLSFADVARSLKRVEVQNPKARILAVDDEEIVLASFRKILVLSGYNVDTVETGPEALTLLKINNYDFVFTDLKMPVMDGVEVTKAVKHLRPDIDVIVITGYATIETAVETMKLGALDYVQKPFTEDELTEFVNKTLIRRQDKIEKQIRPKLHVVTPSTTTTTEAHGFNVPVGIFVSPDHAWANMQPNGAVRIGIDDFAQKLVGKIDDLEMPKVGQVLRKDEPAFALKQGARKIKIRAPFSGKILAVNVDLLSQTDAIKTSPYEVGWVLSLEPDNLSVELPTLMIGSTAIDWYQKEVDKYMEIVKKVGTGKDSNEQLLTEYTKAFFHTNE